MDNKKDIDVYCICNPLIDIGVYDVSDSILEKLGVVKNSMNLVDNQRQVEILSLLQDYKVHTAVGGSGASSAVLFAQLGGRSAFNGKIADDDNGKRFKESLEKSGGIPCLSYGKGQTGSTIILVTKDGARTMNTNLGISREFSIADLFPEHIARSKQLYVTGYCWDTENQKGAVLKALNIAKEAGTEIVLSLADPFCVQRHHTDFIKLLKEHVDIAIMNLEEAQSLSGKQGLDQAVEFISELVGHFLITDGQRGSLLYKDGEQHEIPRYLGDALDTTGAGDCYAAAYMYGLNSGLGEVKAAHLASYFAGLVVQQMGPRIDDDVKSLSDKFLSSLSI